MDSPSQDLALDKLERLQKLLSDGAITNEEFQSLKAGVLANKPSEVGSEPSPTHQRSPQFEGIYRVKDVMSILLWLGVTAGLIAFGYSVLTDPDANTKYGYGPLLIPAATLAALRLKAVFGGIAFNGSEGTMEFPGGGVSFNGVLDLVRPSFILQAILRFQVDVSDIRQIQGGADVSVSQGKVSSRPYLRIIGQFGAARIAFRSEGKRDEAYQHIRLTNRMGTPIFHS